MINCEIELILNWSKNCALANLTLIAAGNNDDPPGIVAPTGLKFQITDTKFYVPVVTLLKENDKKLLGQLKSKLKRTVKWNRYRSQMTVQCNNNNSNHLIDPVFTKANRSFVLLFERNAEEDRRDSFSHYYIPRVEIKGFKVLVDRKSFFDMPVKNEEKAYEKIIETSRNNDYTTGNLLDFACFKENYRLIVIDLSKQTKLKDPQQTNFIGKLGKPSS